MLAAEALLLPADERLKAGLGQRLDMLIGAGFQSAWAASAADVQAAVADLRSKHKKAHIYPVGHSLGASTSLLQAAFLAGMYGRDAVSAVTFAAPPIGNQAFVDAAAANLTRVQVFNGGDPAPLGNLIDQPVAGHVHIAPANGNSSFYCPGKHNPDPRCYFSPSHLPTYYLDREY